MEPSIFIQWFFNVTIIPLLKHQKVTSNTCTILQFHIKFRNKFNISLMLLTLKCYLFNLHVTFIMVMLHVTFCVHGKLSHSTFNVTF